MSQSLTEVYRDRKGPFESYFHLYVGTTLFVIGLLSVIIAAVLATVQINGIPLNKQWEAAGILGGLSIPFAFTGLLAIFPAENRRKSVIGGLLLCGAGVVLFVFAFPNTWHGDTPSYAFHTVATYLTGAITLFSAVFSGIATFKARNDPGGTVSLTKQVVRQTKLVTGREETNKSTVSSTGGVGIIGSGPDGNVETQTNTPASTTSQTTEQVNVKQNK